MTHSPKLDVNAIEARASAATLGPWEADGTCNEGESAIRYYADPEDDESDSLLIAVTFAVFEEDAGDNEANAHFIAACRSDVPALLSELKRVTEERDSIEHQAKVAYRIFREEQERMRRALAFAASCIKSGESWTPTCDEIIGGALSTPQSEEASTPE